MAKKTTGIGSEPWYKSRRVWASALTLLTAISLGVYPLASGSIEVIATTIAAVLGLSSWIFPKV